MSDDVFLDPFAEQPQMLGGIGYYNKLPARTIEEDGSSWTIDRTKGFFGFVKVVEIGAVVEEAGTDGQTHKRCDAGQSQYGPLAFHVWDPVAQVCNCGADSAPYELTGNHDLPFNELTYLSVVFGNPEVGGQVVYIESSNAAAEERVVRTRHSAAARSMQELLRLMMEWEVVYDHFGTTEPMAAVAKSMLTGMNMTQDVRDWVWTNVPPNKVQKYLQGETTAQEADEPPDITGTVVEDWLLEQIGRAPVIGHMPTGS